MKPTIRSVPCVGNQRQEKTRGPQVGPVRTGISGRPSTTWTWRSGPSRTYRRFADFLRDMQELSAPYAREWAGRGSRGPDGADVRPARAGISGGLRAGLPVRCRPALCVGESADDAAEVLLRKRVGLRPLRPPRMYGNQRQGNRTRGSAGASRAYGAQRLDADLNRPNYGPPPPVRESVVLPPARLPLFGVQSGASGRAEASSVGSRW